MVNQKFPRFLRLGDAAVTIQFGLDITRELNQQVSAFINSLEEEIIMGYLPEIIEYVPAVSSATIYFNPECNQADLISSLKRISTKSINNQQIGSNWELPICFDPSFLNDLNEISEKLEINPLEIQKKFCKSILQVFMIGFMPGFPFMGTIPPELSMPRKSSPRTHVPSQSVAIAGKMCGIYPWDSPGGWNLLGKTPVPLFDQNNHIRPTLLRSGDTVSWKPITLPEFKEIFNAQQSKIDWAPYRIQMQ